MSVAMYEIENDTSKEIGTVTV
uniref:Uncharacterized protein n=1 Tax=Moniliophthora roreri TaxID=221103 RepID=A0A0W0F769_MONRR